MTESCREKCLGEPDFTICLDNCVDADLIKAVSEKFGPDAGKTCAGWTRKSEGSLYRLDDNFQAEAAMKASGYRKNIRGAAKAYFLMPKAPYPPSASSSPIGVRDKLPYYPGYVSFIQNEGKPCFEYQTRMKLAAKKAAASATSGLGADSASSGLRVGLLLLGAAVGFMIAKKPTPSRVR